MDDIPREDRIKFAFHIQKLGYAPRLHMEKTEMSPQDAVTCLRDNGDYYKVNYIVDMFVYAYEAWCKNEEARHSYTYYVGHIYHDMEIDRLMESQMPVPTLQELIGHKDLSHGAPRMLKVARRTMGQKLDSRRIATQKLRDSMGALNTDFVLLARNGGLIPIKTGNRVYNLCPNTLQVLQAPWAPLRQDVFPNFDDGGPGGRPPIGRIVKGFRIIDGGGKPS